jgi:hypothetical protein
MESRMPIELTLEKVEREIAAGNLGKARDRLQGLLVTYPDDLTLRRRLGDVYWELQHPAMAGRYWYLEEYKTAAMAAACQAFEHSCGNRSLEILLALKFKGDIESIDDTYAGQSLLKLQRQVREEYGTHIDFQKRGAARYRLTSRERFRAKAVSLGCVLAVLAVGGLAGIGLYSILTWTF